MASTATAAATFERLEVLEAALEAAPADGDAVVLRERGGGGGRVALGASSRRVVLAAGEAAAAEALLGSALVFRWRALDAPPGSFVFALQAPSARFVVVEEAPGAGGPAELVADAEGVAGAAAWSLDGGDGTLTHLRTGRKVAVGEAGVLRLSGGGDAPLNLLALRPPLVVARCRNEPRVRGVSLGGWLVAEEWMAPALFDGAGEDVQGERQLCAALGPQEAARRLARHRDTFVTEVRVEACAALGMNTLRVPVGWWVGVEARGEDVPAPFVPGALAALDRCFEWAQRHGMRVLIDMHAACGAQSPEHHAAPERKKGYGWSIVSAVVGTGKANLEATVAAVEALARRYGAHPALLGVELLNEPHFDADDGLVRQMYLDGYDAVRRHAPSALVVICERPRVPTLEWRNFMTGLRYYNVGLDVHLYNVHMDELKRLTVAEHLDFASSSYRKRVADVEAYGFMALVGEWSAALPVEANYTDDDIAAFVTTQIRAFQGAGLGWCFWSARTDRDGWEHWDALKAASKGWLSDDVVNGRHLAPPTPPPTPTPPPPPAAAAAATPTEAPKSPPRVTEDTPPTDQPRARLLRVAAVAVGALLCVHRAWRSAARARV